MPPSRPPRPLWHRPERPRDPGGQRVFGTPFHVLIYDPGERAQSALVARVPSLQGSITLSRSLTCSIVAGPVTDMRPVRPCGSARGGPLRRCGCAAPALPGIPVREKCMPGLSQVHGTSMAVASLGRRG